MNPDNPYAAPQTLESQQTMSLVPLAESQDNLPRRRSFVEWNTARLKELWDCSRAIHDMQSCWLVMCFAMPVIAFFFSLSFALYDFYFDTTRGIIALSCVGLTFTRFGTGFARSQSSRVFALVMDGLLGFFCALVSVAFVAAIIETPAAAWLLVCYLPIIMLIGYQTVRSLRAMWRAPELFGPQRIPHDALREEVECRERQQID